MRKMQLAVIAAMVWGPLGTVALAQESNPVTSDPPVDAIGRQSETSPGTPNRQNSAPGYRLNDPYYGGIYTSGYYGYDYGYDGASVVITPNAAIIEVD